MAATTALAPARAGSTREAAARGIYYGGAWHAPDQGRYAATLNPGTGEVLGEVAEASPGDVARAVAAAKRAFRDWQAVVPLERARILKAVAEIVRRNAQELASLDAANCGNPVTEMLGDANIAAAQLEFFAGLVTEVKGASIPMGPDRVNFSIRQPLGVVARILAFNHPFMFCAGKIAAPLAAGNTVISSRPNRRRSRRCASPSSSTDFFRRGCSTSSPAAGRRALRSRRTPASPRSPSSAACRRAAP